MLSLRCLGDTREGLTGSQLNCHSFLPLSVCPVFLLLHVNPETELSTSLRSLNRIQSHRKALRSNVNWRLRSGDGGGISCHKSHIKQLKHQWDNCLPKALPGLWPHLHRSFLSLIFLLCSTPSVSGSFSKVFLLCTDLLQIANFSLCN